MMVEVKGQQLLSAREDFRRARRQAAMEDIMSFLTGHSAGLMQFEEVKRKLKATSSVDKGYREIPLEAIVGSVGRYTDFTRSFLPRRESDEHRWASVKVAMAEKGFDPIEVYQIGDVYFVKDGNHRVSIARQSDLGHIPAYVTEIKSKVPLTAAMQPDDLILQEEYAAFLERTELDTLRPAARLETTEPGRYGILEAQIRRHQHWLEQGVEGSVSLPEAAALWYDDVYRPVIEHIHQTGVLRDFPARSESDLYVWVSEHRDRLVSVLGWEVRPEDAARDLAEQSSSQPERVATRLGSRLKESLTLPILESGPEIGQWRRERESGKSEGGLFNEILVTLTGEEIGWLALEQAIIVAKREGARLIGLHVIPPDATPSAEADAMQARFAERCQAAGVAGHLVVESGGVVATVCDRARWTDLVSLTLSHPPSEQPLERLKSGFRNLIRRCPRPLLVVPGHVTELNSALLAYDGSPKAREALYVATYLATAWAIPLTVLTVSDGTKIGSATLDEARTYLEQAGASAHYDLRDGPVAEAILSGARELDSQLIVSGGYGLNSMREVVLGSAVDRVLRELRRPMLICR